MRQQINLYLAIPKRVIVQLPAKMISKICLILLICVLGFSVYGFLRNRALVREFQEVEVRTQAAAEKVKQLTKKYAEDPEILSLTKKIAHFKGDIEIKSRLLMILEHPISLGFSDYLDVLSQQIIPNVWLTYITIAQTAESNVMTLVGKAYELEYITQFMQKLENSSIFANRNFNLSQVTRLDSKEHADQVDEKKQILGFTMIITTEGMRYE
jgi:hypothetical protein